MAERKNIYAYLTTIERSKISFPMNWLKKNDKIKGSILDFGCGYGSDVEILKKSNFDIIGYDNYYFPRYPEGNFDTITCIYVLNVLKPIEQSEVLIKISSLLKHGGKAYFVVRRDIKYEGFRLHKKHKKYTFQTNVVLPFKSIFKNKFCEIYEYQHYDILNRNNSDCIFCSQKSKVIAETALAYAIYDKYPVSQGHSLIIPKRHIASYFDLTFNEQVACNLLLKETRTILEKIYKPSGYNIGINIGKAGGQTINHVHIHLIPRYNGDVKDPIGGVRNIIPERGNYVKSKNLWKK